MPTSFERHVALRYLRRAEGKSEGRRFLRLITVISVGGVALGVTTLILAFSIVRGFSTEIESKIMGYGAHVQVENFQDAPLTGASNLQRILLAMPEIVESAEVVQEFVLLRKSAAQIDGVSLWGTEQVPTYLSSSLTEGTAQFSKDASGKDAIVIGRSLAAKLNLSVGDKVTIFSLRNRAGVSRSTRTPKIKQFHVAGIFETSLANFDELYVFTKTEIARELLEYRTDEVTRFDLTVIDGADINLVADQIDASLEFPYMARSIYDVYRSLFAWVNLQENMIPMIIGIIILVAAFNIIGTLLMIILEKTHEVGILSSMGATSATLQRLFLYLGLYIGVAGVLIGEVCALALAWIQLKFSVIPLPEEAYYMSTAPIELSPYDFILVAIVTLMLCALSSYVPARFAARIEPIKAIHSR